MSHKSAQELFAMLEDAKAKLEIGARYSHYKRPNDFYTLTDVVIIEADDSIGICYRAEYEELRGVTFMRPIDDFMAEVEFEGKMVKRFTKAE